MRFIILVVVLLSFLSAEPREALLIGNSNYEYISELNNPLANLKRLKKSLEEVGFNVKIRTELNAERLEEAIDVFSKRLAKDKETIGFVYYTGHGCQVNHQGYLLPINADSRKQSKIKYRALNINQMIGTLKESGNRVNMFFLDACRDIPVGTKGRSKGLGQIKNTPKGTLVVYATKDGEVAEDNSDFINSIISSMQEPKQSIRNLPYSISDVFKQGSTSQTPIFSAVEIPKIVLKSGYVPPDELVKPKPVYVPETRRVDSSTNTSKWITPSDSVCRSNGGRITNGVCKANWENSKKICSASKGFLPSVGIFGEALNECGGETWSLLMVIENLQNEVKPIDPSCYTKMGFISGGQYWTSHDLSRPHLRPTETLLWSSNPNDYRNDARTVEISSGRIGIGDKDYGNYVRCVRAGQ